MGLVTAEEYLRTSYKPACEYIDGALRKKPMPTCDDGSIQIQFGRLIPPPDYVVSAELTVRIRQGKYLVPDLGVQLRSKVQKPYPTQPIFLCIEILSPVNKHEPGVTKYREKRQSLHEAGVHLLEIDLLRRGQRPVNHPRIPASAYRVVLTRAKSSVGHVWALQLPDNLPVLPIPLRAPDDDITLDLGLALQTIYERAAYDLSIDYREAPPPPTLSPKEAAWWQQRLQEAMSQNWSVIRSNLTLNTALCHVYPQRQF